MCVWLCTLLYSYSWEPMPRPCTSGAVNFGGCGTTNTSRDAAGVAAFTFPEYQTSSASSSSTFDRSPFLRPVPERSPRPRRLPRLAELFEDISSGAVHAACSRRLGTVRPARLGLRRQRLRRGGVVERLPAVLRPSFELLLRTVRDLAALTLALPQD